MSDEVLGAPGAELGVPPPVEEKELVIGGKKFKSTGEAADYMRKAEDEKIAAEAFARGLKESMVSQVNQTHVDAIDPVKALENDFYTDPAQTLMKQRAEIKAELSREIEGKMAQKEMWDNFFDKHKELATAEKREYVEFLVNKYNRMPGWKDLPTSEALERVAALAKESLGSEKVLSNQQVKMTGATQIPQSSLGARNTLPQEPIAFVDQLKNYQKRR
jgi:hypothetical protein